MLKFNDGNDWLDKRINGVKKAYIIPNNISGVAVDIGANVGAFGIVNSSKFNRIIAIEPALETFNRCRENLKMYNHIDVYNLAVSDESNKIVKLRQYKVDTYSGNASTLDDLKYYRDDEVEEVNTISLEGIFEKFNLERINYLKIDCEGSEYSFLMNKDLTKIDYIGVEIHIHLGDKVNELMSYIERTHSVYNKLGDGKTMHYEITYKNKVL